MDIPALIDQCNLGAPPTVVEAIIRAESQEIPLALNVNPPEGVPTPPVPEFTSATDAAVYAVSMVSQGYTVDVGLMQVNSANLARFNVPIMEAFDPCKNIELGTRVYLEAAELVSKYPDHFTSPYARLQATLSVYNTGSPWAGIANGYARRVIDGMRYNQDIAGADMSVSFSLDEHSKDEISVLFVDKPNWGNNEKK
ncbi:transglycosylase SLT domain-containing protein [Sedimenticola thiotaurini]|uniref:transglycosylase SLT domain-containing protein n=1 Tax=Sedimenticola thiotaurini TaxID=1543721 RepID=UPI00069C193D|nr:transglycosylase SLT domain-containing protein [Sedimenticola thiotaurini]